MKLRDRLGRLLLIQDHLCRDGAALSCDQLASRLQVTARTIFRDLSYLRQRGARIEYIPALRGYRWDPDHPQDTETPERAALNDAIRALRLIRPDLADKLSALLVDAGGNS